MTTAKQCIESITSDYTEAVRAAELEVNALAKRLSDVTGTKVTIKHRNIEDYKLDLGWAKFNFHFADRPHPGDRYGETGPHLGTLLVYHDGFESVVSNSEGGSVVYNGLTADNLVAALMHLEEQLPQTFEDEQDSLEAQWREHARSLYPRGLPEAVEGEIRVEKAEELRAAAIADCRELAARLARPGFRATIAYTPPNFYPGGDHRVEDGRSSIVIMGHLTGGAHLGAKDFSDPSCSITRSSPGAIGELGFYYNYHYAPVEDEDAEGQEGDDLRRLTFGVWTPMVWKTGKSAIVFPGTTMGLAEALMHLEESINEEIDFLLKRRDESTNLNDLGTRMSELRKTAEGECQQMAKTYGYTLSKDKPTSADMLSDYERSRIRADSNFSLILRFCHDSQPNATSVLFYMLRSHYSSDPAMRAAGEIFRVRDNVFGQTSRIQEFPATPLGLANALVFANHLLKDVRPPQTA